MSMIGFVNAMPVWLLAVTLIGAAIAFSVGLQLLARWVFGIERLITNHEVAGTKFNVVGVAYAVLLAFVVFGVWNEFIRTDHAVQAEAERFYDMHRNSYNFPDEAGARIRQALIAYATAVRDADWPMMEIGVRGSTSAAEASTRLSFAVGQTKPESIGLLPSVIHAIDLMQQIADARLERLSDVRGHLTPPIWVVLLLGAAVTLSYPAFFAAKELTAQILMTAGLAAIVGAIFFLTINLNYPFSGPDRVTAAPIDQVIQRIVAESETPADQR